MYARTIRAGIVPGTVDEAVRTYEQEVLPVLQEQRGYVSTTVMFDRDRDEALVVTLWISREEAEATGPGSDYLAEQLARLQQYLVSPDIRHWDVPIAAQS